MHACTLITKKLVFSYLDTSYPALSIDETCAKAGQLIFVTGDSGCGKSTLLNIINGTIPHVIEGTLTGELKRFDSQGNQVIDIWQSLGTVFQNPRSQFFSTNSTAELVFGMENFGYSKKEIDKRLDDIISKYQAQNLLDRNIFELSSGERQKLALLSALIIDPTILLFDEPSANLDYHHTRWLAREFANLKNEGKTIIVADHRSFYLDGLIDSYWYIDNGKLNVYHTRKECIAHGYHLRPQNLWDIPLENQNNHLNGSPALSVVNLSFKNILKSTSLTCNTGEITFLVGANGAGKTTLARLISGALKPDSGYIKTYDTPLYLMQDADFQLFGSSCVHELTLGIEKHSNQKTPECINAALEAVGLKKYAHHHPQQLSGGQKQRLQIAIALMSKSHMWIMDEPTSGLDQHSMHALIKQLNRIRPDHAVLIISHDYEFIVKTADRIIYLKEGTVADSFRLNEQTLPQLQQIFLEMEESS